MTVQLGSVTVLLLQGAVLSALLVVLISTCIRFINDDGFNQASEKGNAPDTSSDFSGRLGHLDLGVAFQRRK